MAILDREQLVSVSAKKGTLGPKYERAGQLLSVGLRANNLQEARVLYNIGA